MKRNLMLVIASLLMLTQCAAGRENWNRPVPSIEDVFRTTSHEERILKLFHAVKRLNDVPYVWGGTSPHWGMDCSGFTQYVMREIGVSIPRTVREQAKAGENVSTLMPGDLVFFDADRGRKGLDHVGIYLGRSMFAHSESPMGVTISGLEDYDHKVRLARRVMHERTVTVESSASLEPERGEVSNVVVNIQRASEQVAQAEKKPAPTYGKVKRIRLEGGKVFYTIEREGSSPYEFHVSWETHESLAVEGDLLGRELEWDDGYVWVREWWCTER
jgi:cell wall-associated NlpC family hydrolase